MAWTESKPDDFSTFTPFDVPTFLDHWERTHAAGLALLFAGAYVEGVAFPFMESISNNQAPSWLRSMLRWQLAAQWAYQMGESLGDRLMSEGLIPVWLPGMPEQLRLTPKDLAEIPPQLRAGFKQAMGSSMQWVKNLSTDTRNHIRMIVSIQQMKNQNPKDVVALLERVLRRDRIARELGIPVESVDDEAIDYWLSQVNQKVIAAIAHRANMISITESSRAQANGIFDSMELQGKTRAFVMPHRGTCPECQRLLDGRVFEISVLRRNGFANFGQKKGDWVAAMPQHPLCRHSPMDVPVKFRNAINGIQILPEKGLLLEYFGLPGGATAMESLSLEKPEPWLTPGGKMVA